MISFKEITLEDKKDIDACFAGNRCRTCDFSFANLFSWKPKFKTQFAIVDKTLFLRFNGEKNKYFYMMPSGKMPLEKSLSLIMEDAEHNKTPFVMKGITRIMWELIRRAKPNLFEYTPDRDNAEYLYLSEKLISLSGKKLQKKRNHLNRFKLDNPDWEYFPITSKEEVEECIKMLDVWSNDRPEDETYYDYDHIASTTMLRNFKELELKGGAIKVNGKMIAFTAGAQLTDDTFVVHMEKAFGEINGAYTIINQQFAEHEASAFKYVNREEDMGLENLRKAKMSYYPEMLLEEGIITMK